MPEFLCNNPVFEKIIILHTGRNVGRKKFNERVPRFFAISGFSEPFWDTHTSTRAGQVRHSRQGRCWDSCDFEGLF